MATFDGVFSTSPYNHILRLTVTQTSQNIAANTTVVSWVLQAIKNTTSGGFSSNANPWAVNIDGTGYSGTFTYNFSGQAIGYTITIASGTTTITHNADGTKTISVSSSANTTVLGNASNGGAMALTTIPRASTPTFDVNPIDAGQTVTITTNRASGTFTHDITYAIGAASGTIDTGVGASTTWAIPLSLMNQFPNATSGAVTITTVTKSGATVIGSKAVVLTVRAPVTVVPDIGSVTHSEATTSPNVASIVGAYVKTISKLLVGMTGAAGAYSSTITSSKIELIGTDGVTVLWSVAATGATAATGTSTTISQSGTLTLKGTVTDSRGRSYSESVSVTVMNYAQPNISSFTAVRSSSGGTPIPAGTYIRVDVASAVQSLIVGTQKNELKYRLRIRQRGDSTPWASITPAASSAGVGGVGFTDDIIVGTYAVANGWDVRFELEDNLGSIAVFETSVGTGGVLFFLDKDLDMIGVGKFPETYDVGKPTSIDALEYIYHRSGKRVLDVDDVVDATTTVKGRVELATLAETNTGTDTTRAVTPSGLATILSRIAAQETGSSLPVFQAKLTSSFAKSGTNSWTKIPFTNELVDVGGCYDAANSRFTAPVAGRYEFFMSVVTGEVTGGPLYSFRLNTATLPVGPFDGGGYSVNYASMMMTRIFDMAAGDTMEAWVYNGNNVSMTLPSTYGNFFSGKMVR